jgi:hypothetical protein
MIRERIYFRDTNKVECWRNCEAFGWVKLEADAFDDLPHTDYRYMNFDTKPENWLGDRAWNPMPRIAI